VVRRCNACRNTLLKSSFELANNYVVHNHSDRGYFVTLFFAVLDTCTGAVRSINGGHLLVFIIGPDGTKQRLPAIGSAVELLPYAHFAIEETQLEQGDIMFACSDGVTDARNPARHFFGMQRLIELVAQPSASAEALKRRVDDSLSLHIADADQYDDITMLVVQRQH